MSQHFLNENVCFLIKMETDWNIECSDDEYKDCKGPWQPPPEIIEKYYEQLSNGEIPELNWKCPGYRSLSPEQTDTPPEEMETKQVDDKSDFDFLDEALIPRLKIRNKGEEALKGSAKKKTTSLDGVINNMRRHNLLPNSNN